MLSFSLLYFIVSLLFTKYYFLYTSEFYEPAYSINIANFEADKVFQKRFLIPVISQFLSEISPVDFEYILKSLTVISMFVILLSFKSLLDLIVKKDYSLFWPLFILLPVSWNYFILNSIYHAYDIPSLMFYLLGICLFLREKYFLFYLIFIFGTFNRESTCFITISLLLIRSTIKGSSIRNNVSLNLPLIKHLLFQTFIWIASVQVIQFVITDCPGNNYEITYSFIQFLNAMISGQPSWPYLDSSYFFTNPRCFLTLFGCSWALIPLLWKYIPTSCKKLLLLIPIYMVPAILYANLMETRVYHELNVVIALALTSGFIRFKYPKEKFIS